MGFFTDTTSASAARRARSRASSGTTCPPTGTPRGTPTTTRAGCRPRPGGTFASWRWPPRRRRSAGPPTRATSPRARVARPLGLHVGRVQALHERRLPRRVPDRRADPHGVRDRGRPARRLQRLRLLHPVVPVRRDRPRPLRRPRGQVHALLRPARGRAGAGVREGVPHRLDPVRRVGGARRVARGAGRELHERGIEGAYLYGAGDARERSWPAVWAPSSCSPSRPSASGCRRRPTRRSSRTSCPPRGGAGGGLVAAAVGGGGVPTESAMSRRAARRGHPAARSPRRRVRDSRRRWAGARAGSARAVTPAAGAAALRGVRRLRARRSTRSADDPAWPDRYGDDTADAGGGAARAGEMPPVDGAAQGSSKRRCGRGRCRCTSASAAWRPGRRSSRWPATSPATSAPRRSRARSRWPRSRRVRRC